VKLKLKPQVEELTMLLDSVMSRSRAGAPPQEKLLQGAEQEIDDLFQW
jgi:hypothetical protein